MTDIEKTVFLYIPEHLAKYYEIVFPSIVTTAFPLASKELVWAGNALAVGAYTACVFHSMRAAEIGVRVLGNELGVEFPDKPLELAEWQNILDKSDSIIGEMKKMRRGTDKDEKLNFYSQAAVQFRYFKDAWRVRVAHARESYEERDAIKVFTHTHEFFETLATRLKEPKPSV
jgi:HEPN domain-containing protein